MHFNIESNGSFVCHSIDKDDNDLCCDDDSMPSNGFSRGIGSQHSNSSKGNNASEVYQIAQQSSKDEFVWQITTFVILISTCALLVGMTFSFLAKEYDDDDEEAVSNMNDQIHRIAGSIEERMSYN